MRIPVALALVAVFVGMLLEVMLGSGFIWLASAAYSAVAGWMFLALVPVCAVGLHLLEGATGSLRSRYPTGVVRWVFIYPVFVVIIAGLLVCTPWGWSAALGWTFGTPSRVDVRVAAVSPRSERSRSCHQPASLEFRGATARICLDGRLAGAVPVAGETVAVYGRVSSLGLYVQRVHGR